MSRTRARALLESGPWGQYQWTSLPLTNAKQTDGDSSAVHIFKHHKISQAELCFEGGKTEMGKKQTDGPGLSMSPSTFLSRSEATFLPDARA